ncbi:Isoflavone reductase-like protein [Zostera marina]|uniref:Isoflavone reductase-like protein n=1 Tax=Zostera marina TaxID=29655 RepID=A0A0K9PUL1_ZOSMR|nr:Isoflavone reductase-like protein [Zostera marina]
MATKILIMGGTGYIGKFIVLASAKSEHPTFAMVRSLEPSSPKKAAIYQSFKDAGVTLIKGDLYDHESLVSAFKQVDIVISTVGSTELKDQVNIIAAIKECGNIKRFFPSEFGNDVDHVEGPNIRCVEPAKSLFGLKAKIRRTIEAEGIPYTYVCPNSCAGYFLPNIGQIGKFDENFSPLPAPREKLDIIGDGTPKAIFVNEEDIGTYTIKAVDDPRTLNKTLCVRPPSNIMSFNDVVSLWEKKIGNTLVKTYLSEEQVLEKTKTSPYPVDLFWAILYSAFIAGVENNFEIEPSFGVEATELYPDVKYTTVDEYLDHFV